jgi:hypothetical protein
MISCRRLVCPAATLAIATYYLWAAQASGTPFVWNQDLGGYYNLLARAFAQGHFYLPVAPSHNLLALPNPYDPIANAPYRLHDAVLFGGRYYLHHLPAPAVVLFLPWRLVTGHDLPENFAVFLFCLGGFAFSAGSLTQLLKLAEARPGQLMLALMLLALGICQGVPYLLSRVRMYEVAIAGGYFFASAGLYCLIRATGSANAAWRGVSGLLFGLAMASRPHLAMVAVAAFVALVILRQPWMGILTFILPMIATGMLLMLYNYERFGSVFEFGGKYMLAGIGDSSTRLAGRNVPPGIYYLLFCAPEVSAVFPWFRPILRFPFDLPSYGLPPKYFLEPTSGGLWAAPFLIGMAGLPLLRRTIPLVRVLLWSLTAATLGVLLFLAGTGWATQRYEVDFLPLTALVALTMFGILGWRWGSSVLIVAGLVVSLAFGTTGPNDEMLKNHPEAYLQIARAFSPIAKYRPALNPEFSTAFTAEFIPQPDNYREPLVTLGRQAHRYYLYAEHVGGKVRIASYRELSEIDCVIEPSRPVQIALKYDRVARVMHVSIDGQERLTHLIGNLVTAPDDVTIGQNRIDPNITNTRFTGRIQ